MRWRGRSSVSSRPDGIAAFPGMQMRGEDQRLGMLGTSRIQRPPGGNALSGLLAQSFADVRRRPLGDAVELVRSVTRETGNPRRAVHASRVRVAR